MAALEAWIERQYRHAAAAMLWSISPVRLTKSRPGFGQTIVPRRGSMVASPVLAAYDPDPDYFFHWFRDSAHVIDALRVLHADHTLGAEALEHLAEFAHFSLDLNALDGRALVAASAWRARVAPDFVRFLRSDAELATVHGERVSADVRVNPDGTLDISTWGRPQHDGPALRALALLRWMNGVQFDPELAGPLEALVRGDLEYARRFAREPCFDIWEEENGLHYYTLCVSAAALEAGAAFLEAHREPGAARACRDEAHALRRLLDDYWLQDAGYYRSRVLASGARSTKELDIAVILAAIHAPTDHPSHSVRDPRMHATLARLEALFDAAYAINRNRPVAHAAALGRYPGDVYYSGGAYYFSTLGAAEFCFRAARGSNDAHALRRHGDAFLETVRAFTPADGALSEQFDQKTGAQTSAKHLAWSYAAFITCIAARRAAA
jgi:glucoamylase